MNNNTPYRSPSWTILVWCPSSVDSRTTSRHQINIHDRTPIKPKNVDSKPPI
jgi:hypothetical protein